MGEIDTFGTYVRRRLDHWGDVFALARDMDYLGHQSKNMLQVLIEHKGEMPGRTQGFKPLDVDREAMQIELMVADLARDRVDVACAMRAYYCGSGRRKVERFETALLLIATSRRNSKIAANRLPDVRKYLGMVESGNMYIRGGLIGFAHAA